MRLEHMKKLGLALLLALPLTVAPSWADEHEEEDGGWIAKVRERVSSAVGQLSFGGGRFYVGFTGGQTSLDLDDGAGPPFGNPAAATNAATRRAALAAVLGLELSVAELATAYPDNVIGTSNPTTVAANVNGNLARAMLMANDLANLQPASGAMAATTVLSELDDDADSSFKLYAGYQLNDMVAVEAFYVDHGSYDMDVTYSLGQGHVYRDRQAATINGTDNINIYVNVPISGSAMSSLSYDSSAFGVTVPIGWQVHPNVRAFVKAGLTFWDVEVDEDTPGPWTTTLGGAASAITLVSGDTAVTNASDAERADIVQTVLRQATGVSTVEVTAATVDTASASFSVANAPTPAAARGTAEALDLDEADDGVGFHFGVGADFSYGDLPLNIRVEYEGWTSDPASGNFSIGLHYLF